MTAVAELSRRERQIMDIIYRRGEATAAEILSEIDDPPSYSAIRALLRVLETKGHLDHREDGPRYVFRPTRPRGEVSESALKRVVRTFFGGSVEATVAALLELEDGRLSDAELDRLAARVAEARQKGD